MPCRKSTDTEKAVCIGAVLSATIGRKFELVQPLARGGRADQSAAMRGQEVDRFRRRLLRCQDEISLVLPVFVIDHDDDPTLLDVRDRGLDRVEHGGLGGRSRVARGHGFPRTTGPAPGRGPGTGFPGSRLLVVLSGHLYRRRTGDFAEPRPAPHMAPMANLSARARLPGPT